MLALTPYGVACRRVCVRFSSCVNSLVFWAGGSAVQVNVCDLLWTAFISIIRICMMVF